MVGMVDIVDIVDLIELVEMVDMVEIITIVKMTEMVEKVDLVEMVKMVERGGGGSQFFDEAKLSKRVRKLSGKSVQAPVLGEINYRGWGGGVAVWIK